MHSLKANRVRSILSLLGMTLGIFSIVITFSIVDSFTGSIKDSMESVGNDVVYIQKWPWGGGGGGGEFKWWKYFQRPEPSYEEARKLEDRLRHAKDVAFMMVMGGNLNYRSNTVSGVRLNGISHPYMDIWKFNIANGRYFSAQESHNGRNVAVIGSDVAEGLFGGMDPIGKQIRILGEKLTVIGVIEKEGSKMIGESHDEQVLMPVNFMRRKVNENQIGGTAIMVKAQEGVGVEQLKSEIQGVMRGVRRLRPRAEDDFSLNEISVIQSSAEMVFQVLWVAGLVIGGFALIAGGIGVANIMFVSVAERISQIGVQKALGAKSKFILAQFLSEAVILSMIGGFLGLLVTWIALYLIRTYADMDVDMSVANMLSGVLTSAGIGVVFGLFPALNASRKDPVEAMRAS